MTHDAKVELFGKNTAVDELRLFAFQVGQKSINPRQCLLSLGYRLFATADL